MTGDTVRTGKTGRLSGVGGAAQRLTTAGAVKCGFGVLVKAAASNTANGFVGFSANITADSADATDGYLLEPGQEVAIEIDEPGNLWLIWTGSQKFFFMAI